MFILIEQHTHAHTHTKKIKKPIKTQIVLTSLQDSSFEGTYIASILTLLCLTFHIQPFVLHVFTIICLCFF